MGFDAPGIAPAKKKRAPLKRKAPPKVVSDRASDHAQTKADKAAVRADKRQADRAASAAIGAALIGGPARKQLTPPRRKGPVLGRATPGTIPAPLARVVRNTARATVEATVRDPLKQAAKNAKQGADIARGSIAALGGVYTIGKELATKGHSDTGKKLVHDVGADYSRRYGPAFRDEDGAYKAQLERQRAEGSLPEILDLATAAIPSGEGATIAARTLAKAAPATRAGRAAAKAVAATEKRAPLRESAGHVAEQKTRRTVPGAAVTSAHDAARKKVQKRAVKKAAAGRKPLDARRAAAQDGEVVAISKTLANKRARVRTAKTARVEREVASGRIRRELTGTKGGRNQPQDKTLRANMQALPSDAHRESALLASQYGIRDSRGAHAVLSRRVAQIEKERAKAPLTKAELGAHDELPALKKLLHDPGIFDRADVRRVADVESARATRLSAPESGLAPERHALAKHQAQADTLGVERVRKESAAAHTERVSAALGIKRDTRNGESEPAFRRRLVAGVRALPDDARAVLVKRASDEPAELFLARVKAAADEHGLAEPGYVPSRFNAADEAPSGQGLGGVAQPAAGGFTKREGEVFRRGLERKDPALAVSKLAQTVRGGARLAADNEVYAREGLPFKSHSDARAWIADNNVDPDSVWIADNVTVRRPGGDRGAYATTTETRVVPAAVKREMDDQRRSANVVERVAARAQSVQQAVLLGASPSWFQFQILADSLTLGAAGGLHKLISANREYRKMSDEDRELVDIAIGGSPANDVLIEKGGEQLSRLAAVLATSPTYRKFVQGRRPLTSLLRAEGARAAAFRRAAFAARAAKIDKDIVAARAPQARVQAALAKAHDNPGDLARLLSDPKAAEAAAEHVAKIMGNFADYTAVERRFLRSVVPFYGFLRYSMRLAFYTLPIDHPYVAVLIAQLGRIGADEARDLVGPDLPYGLSKFYNSDGTKAVDLARASPLLNALSASTTVGQLGTAFLPPIAVLGANQVAGKNLFTGKDYKVDGAASPTPGNDLTPTDRARIAAHELLNWLAPSRAYEKTLDAPQTDDTLPFSRKPIVAVDPATANDIEERTADKTKQKRWERLWAGLMPLTVPQQPTQDPAIGAANTENKAERKALRDKRTKKRADIQGGDTRATLRFERAKLKAARDEIRPEADDLKALREELTAP